MPGCVTQVTDLVRGSASNQAIKQFTPRKKAMKSNVGGIDRILRIAIGLVLVGLAATGTVGLWGWIGIVPLATGLIGWCPPYALLGWNTCAMKK
ncbi:hypothetical protein BH10PSE16_BH10PSE16_35090 [soil metagenome]